MSLNISAPPRYEAMRNKSAEELKFALGYQMSGKDVKGGVSRNHSIINSHSNKSQRQVSLPLGKLDLIKIKQGSDYAKQLAE